MKQSTIATLAGLLTALGTAWAVFIDHEVHMALKMTIVAMPAIGGWLTQTFSAPKKK
jgi:hypothetical protein